MSLSAGTVTVASDETASGSGLAKALYDADVATLSLPTVPTLGSTAAPYRVERPVSADDVASVKAGRLTTLQEAARRANAYGAAIVSYLLANAEISTHVIIGGGEGGLQRTPNPNDPDTATQGPAFQVELAQSPFAGTLS